ncbi:MAG: hypothetical protein HZB34_05290 [Nitrospirae bacterium]|nr:hypothetical protein [Nitrospirota bacterium]
MSDQTDQMNQPGLLAMQSAIDVPGESGAGFESVFVIAVNIGGFLRG